MDIYEAMEQLKQTAGSSLSEEEKQRETLAILTAVHNAGVRSVAA